MTAAETLRPRAAYTCPACGWSGEFETRFPAWCLSCTYGADPDFPEQPGFWKRRREAAASRRNARLFARLVSAAQLRPTGPMRVTVIGVAVLIHVTTLALFLGGLTLLLLPPVDSPWVVGGPAMMVLAWAVRPRVARLRKDARLITRADAPELFGLLDEMTALMGAEPMIGATVNTWCGAATQVFGLRRRRVLRIGIPLWEVLGPQERVALLAHELAHSVNSDAEYGLVVLGALHTVGKWYAVAHPLTRLSPAHRPRIRSLVDLVLPIHLLHRGATAMLRRSKPRAEYLADHLAAGIASTDATCALFERTVTAKAATAVLTDALKARVPSHPWRIVRDYAAALPEHERRRLALLGERQEVCVDSTHPPTHLRIRMLRERPALPARVVLGAERAAAIEAELAGPAEQLAAKVTDFARR